LRILPLDLGCSGMAGTFGMTARGFAPSLKAGKHLFARMKEPDVDYAVTQCSACKLQIEQGAGRKAVHPAHWFAMAYRLADKPASLLAPPRRGLIA
jgi:Fe-S oxidoreductase